MEKNKSNHLLCFLCNKKFQRPKILDCLHSYCQKCLQDMQQSNKFSSEEVIRCPTCRQMTRLSSGGVNGTKTNIFLVRLVEEADVSEILKDKSLKVSCGLCQKDAASRCYDCAKFLCSSCQKTHNQLPVSIEHDVYSLEDCRAGKLPERSPSQDGALECPKHAGGKCRFFCQTCQELICCDCTVLDHRSDKSHKYTSLQTAALSERQSTKVLVSRLVEKIPELETSLKILEKMEPALKSHAEKTKAQVQAMADKIREDVKAQETRLLREIRHESSQQIKELKETQKAVTASLNEARFSLGAAGVFIESSMDGEFLWLQSTLVKNLQDLVLRDKPSGPQALKFMEDGGDICLGQLKKEDIIEAISKEVALEKIKEKKEKPTGRALPQKSTNVQSKEKAAANKENPRHKQQDIKGSLSASSNSEGESSNSNQSNKPDKTSSSSTSLTSSTDHDAPDGKASNKPPSSVSTRKSASSVAAVRKTKDAVLPSDRVLRSSSRANMSQNVSPKSTVQQSKASTAPGLSVLAETTVSSGNQDQASTWSTVQQQGRDRLTPGMRASGTTSSSSLGMMRQTFPESNQPKPSVNGKQNNGFQHLPSSTDSYQAVHGGNQSDTDSDDSDL